ncbi:MAG: LacI family DNA-binding transcriptional regulator [Lautropia sp.]|nr:LacI family DNA-binding transcriptional regulator [Lautropia sp.]
MKARTVTSHDVARLAGVARSTVSHVLNGSNAVRLSEETRDKVRQAALKLGYRPNSAALMLRHGTTKTVGLLVTQAQSLTVDQYISLLFSGIGHVLRREGYHLLLETFDHASHRLDELHPRPRAAPHATDSTPGAHPDATPEATAHTDRYADLVLTQRIDGLIVLSPDPTSDELRSLVDGGFPIVLIGSIGSPNEVSIEGEVKEAMAAAVKHLVELGHRHIGCIPFSPPGFPASDLRTGMLRELLQEHGLELPDDAIEPAAFSAASGHQAARALLTRRPQLTALLAGNDTIALGVLGGAAAQGRSVPGDLSVIGFDDLPFAAYMHPALTTIRQDAVAQGEAAAELLVARLTGTQCKTQPAGKAVFVPRQSTGPAPHH